MFDFLYNDISYLGLFMVCFLSSTLLPLASEAFVLGFIKLDFTPNLVLIVATLGNTLGSLSTYALAYFGKEKILEKYFSKSLKKLENFNANFAKFGSIFFFTFSRRSFCLGTWFCEIFFFKNYIFYLTWKIKSLCFHNFHSKLLLKTSLL